MPRKTYDPKMVKGTHFAKKSRPVRHVSSVLPIGFEDENCYGAGKENCEHYFKYACPGSCKWVENIVNTKNKGLSFLEDKV
jgi:hypothetical protein